MGGFCEGDMGHSGRRTVYARRISSGLPPGAAVQGWLFLFLLESLFVFEWCNSATSVESGPIEKEQNPNDYSYMRIWGTLLSSLRAARYIRERKWDRGSLLISPRGATPFIQNESPDGVAK